MATKAFGVKELRIDGSGTPTIESPNDGNLNVTAATATFSGTATIRNILNVKGTSANDAILNLFANDGTNNDDKWRIRSDATGNDLKFESYYSGSWSDGSPLKLASNGVITMTGQAVIDEVNINGNGTHRYVIKQVVNKGKIL